MEYRPLEGFVLAISPFNFTAIGGNLASAPALVGNVVLWKPSPAATYSNYIIHQILLEAGLPGSVIQFVPGEPEVVVKQALAHRDFAGLHFTGSTNVFRSLWKQIGDGVGEGRYKGYPRVVGETGGKNFHFVHQTANIENAVHQSVRAAFEYQGEFISLFYFYFRFFFLIKKQAKNALRSRGCTLHLLYGRNSKPSLWRRLRKSKLGRQKIGRISWVRSCEHIVAFLPLRGDLKDSSGKPGFDKITGYIEKAKDAGGEIIYGGTFDGSKGYFIQPTVIVTKDPKSVTMVEEIFGPVVTVRHVSFQ